MLCWTEIPLGSLLKLKHKLAPAGVFTSFLTPQMLFQNPKLKAQKHPGSLIKSSGQRVVVQATPKKLLIVRALILKNRSPVGGNSFAREKQELDSRESEGGENSKPECYHRKLG